MQSGFWGLHPNRFPQSESSPVYNLTQIQQLLLSIVSMLFPIGFVIASDLWTYTWHTFILKEAKQTVGSQASCVYSHQVKEE